MTDRETLLDIFAAQALAGLVGTDQAATYEIAAAQAYRYADAMMAEKDRRAAAREEAADVAFRRATKR